MTYRRARRPCRFRDVLEFVAIFDTEKRIRRKIMKFRIFSSSRGLEGGSDQLRSANSLLNVQAHKFQATADLSIMRKVLIVAFVLLFECCTAINKWGIDNFDNEDDDGASKKIDVNIPIHFVKPRSPRSRHLRVGQAPVYENATVSDSENATVSNEIGEEAQGEIGEEAQGVDTEESVFEAAAPLEYMKDEIDPDYFEWINKDEVVPGGTTCGFMYPDLGSTPGINYPRVKVYVCMRFAENQPAPKGNIFLHCGGPSSTSGCALDAVGPGMGSENIKDYNLIGIDQVCMNSVLSNSW